MPNEKSNTGVPAGFQLRELPEEPDKSSQPPPSGGGESQATSAFEHLGELPHGYGEDTIFLVAQEPHWLFTYWDIGISKHPGGPTFLRYSLEDGTKEGEIEVPFETRNWYIPVHKAGSRYYVEIGYYRGDTWKVIARSATVETPPEKLSESEAFDFATLPFHLGFQRLLENIQSAVKMGEDVIQALARMQRQGDFTAFGGPALPALTPDQRKLLEALLGVDLLEQLCSGGLSSAEIEAKIRSYLEERLSSEGASALVEKAREILGSSSLFSGAAFGAEVFSGGAFSGGAFSAGAFGGASETTSWSVGAFASWAAGALSSWITSAASSFGGVTSWSAASSWAAPTSWAGGASWPAGASWSGAIPSSWEQAAESSWSLAAISSWVQAVQSSWSQAVLSSWNLAAVSSWSSAAVSSWGGSEVVSSFSLPREFFMNVNAEVIFYGGTDPRARVTIAGKPVQLYPDGTFRYHFVFPNATYEIPITAQSPDGVETRIATLKFDRKTEKVGVVEDTPQPPLGAPMGRIDT